ncbi:virulence factor TspB C-terminal domain-related protein [Roseateles microcysteis]|uniref:virulence factor TspB C-terminal domain-related protein n=1 Tax=Roseateles microcysteis TaxID=3119057 RepID=UPI003A7F171D
MSFASAIDQTNRLGGGCPSDVSISYAGRSWVIPWSQHCDKLQLIGNLMVSVCMLAAAFIVFRN